MAVPEHTLLFMAALASVVSVGPFLNTDRITQAVAAFLAFVVWGVVGQSSFDVIVGESASETAAIMEMVALGHIFALVLGLVFLVRILQMFRDEGDDVEENVDGMF